MTMDEAQDQGGGLLRLVRSVGIALVVGGLALTAGGVWAGIANAEPRYGWCAHTPLSNGTYTDGRTGETSTVPVCGVGETGVFDVEEVPVATVQLAQSTSEATWAPSATSPSGAELGAVLHALGCRDQRVPEPDAVHGLRFATCRVAGFDGHLLLIQADTPVIDAADMAGISGYEDGGGSDHWAWATGSVGVMVYDDARLAGHVAGVYGPAQWEDHRG